MVTESLTFICDACRRTYTALTRDETEAYVRLLGQGWLVDLARPWKHYCPTDHPKKKDGKP